MDAFDITPRLLVFDIGSNSVRTARCSFRGGRFYVFDKQVYTTRLAEGLLHTRRLSNARMQQSLDVIEACFARAQTDGFASYAYATAAVRDAENGASFCAAVEAMIGKGRLRVLRGDEEARFARLGADAGETRPLIDIGGASAQIVTPLQAISYPMGCVRAKDAAPFPTLFEIQAALFPTLDALFSPLPRVSDDVSIGVGGTLTTLALLCAGKNEFDPLFPFDEHGMTQERLFDTLSRLSDMGDAVRKEIPLLSERHDVILHGGAIALYLMRKLNLRAMYASLCDGLDGYARHLCETLQTRA